MGHDLFPRDMSHNTHGTLLGSDIQIKDAKICQLISKILAKLNFLFFFKIKIYPERLITFSPPKLVLKLGQSPLEKENLLRASGAQNERIKIFITYLISGHKMK